MPGWHGHAARRSLAAAALLLFAAACNSSGPVDVSSPPETIKGATRLTYYQAAASVAQSRYQIVEDPSCANGGPGCLRDPRTGKSYRRTDEGPLAQDQPTASGDGYSQIDVVAVDGREALVMLNLYGIDRSFGQFVWSPLGATRVDARVADGLWIHPAELARLEREGLAGMLVARGPYRIGETTYDSLAFWSVSGGGHFSHTYDMQTGLLVAANTSTAGATSPFRVQGEDPPRGNTQLTLTRLAGVRQRALPVGDGETPQWVVAGRQLRYAGTYNWINPVDPTTGNLTYPVQHLVTLNQVGPGWATYAAQTLVPALGQDQRIDGATGTTGLYWYAPSALAAMSAGQVLDKDPVTGEQLSVSFVGEVPGGANVVTIDSQLPGVSARATYGRNNGILLAYEVRMASSGITISLQLQESP